MFDNNVMAIVPTGLNSRYLHYWLSTVDLGEMANPGPVPSINEGPVRDLPVPEIGVYLGEAIADYLDAEVARIDALIAKKRRMIALVEQRWRALVDDVLMPTTGIRLKHLLSAPLAYGVLVPEHDLDGVPMLRITDLTPRGVNLEYVTRIPPAMSAQYRRTIVAAGDLVVSVVGTLGRSIEITEDLVGCNLNRALARVQLLPNVPRNLIRFWFESDLVRDLAWLATSGDSAQPTLGLGDLKNFIVGIPDDPVAWQGMAKYLEERHIVANQSLNSLRRQIDLLLEHRQALITAAVTGALDIPGVPT